MSKRIYVAKRPEVADTEERLLREWRTELVLEGITGVRIWHRYDVEGVDDELMARAATTVFAEPPADVWTERPDIAAGAHCVAVELLPGQYDQRADSAAQCLRLLEPDCDAVVAYATLYVVEGALTPEEWVRLKRHLINPIESREASPEIPATLRPAVAAPADVLTVDGWNELTRTALAATVDRMGLAMDTADAAVIQHYFGSVEHRDPTLTELKVLDTYWSDHCRHTTFATELTGIDIAEGRYGEPIRQAYERYLDTRADVFGEAVGTRPVTLMDMATLASRDLRRRGGLTEWVISDEINACTIRTEVHTAHGTEDWHLLFKNETHNHPTEIEPFGGAATCLGGCIRDPLSGRAYVYQAMRVTGSGDPRTPLEDTPVGKLPQRVITTKAAAGYSSYGNQIGLATGEVHEYYHPGYVAKRMEIGAVVGAVPAAAVRHETPAPGDVVILVGGRTGRDGLGGATGSSVEHDVHSLAERGAEVQKGNAPTERKLQRLFRQERVTRLIRRCNDFGAGGVSVAVGELADGVKINLDLLPKKYEGLDGTELALSESQERMAVVVAADDAAAFCRYADEENLEATVIAEVTADPRLVMTWRGRKIVDLARSFLATNGASRQATAQVAVPADEDRFALPEVTDVAAAWRARMTSTQVASQRGLAERFDSTVGAGTVLMPFGGERQMTPTEGMAALIPVPTGDAVTVSLMAHGFDPYLSSWSPFHGAYYAVLWSVARIVALGGDRRNVYLTLQEYFEKMGTAASWGKPVAALLGAFAAQQDLAIGAIGGKDSMSGTFMDLHVPPTLVSFAVTTDEADHVVSPEWKAPGHALVWAMVPTDEAGMPDIDVFTAHADRLYDDIGRGVIASASALTTDGLAAQAARAAFGNGIGATLTELTAAELMAPQPVGWLIETDDETAAAWVAAGDARRIGTTGGTALTFGETTLDVTALGEEWESVWDDVFPRTADIAAEAVVTPPVTAAAAAPTVRTRIARPKVLIPVMPGTNCEYDTARAFAAAGAEPEILVVRNLTATMLQESVDALVKSIGTAQILAFPGGFSAGDEPEGSGKFIAALFRHPQLTEAVSRLLAEQDGLIIGICNGFQALIKLGLVPYGDIREMTPDAPTLTYNRIGRHVSGYVTTRVAANTSPWLAHCREGELHAVPISHGEGRLMAPPEVLARLAAAGQIATQYVDPDGRPTMDGRYNPNGSMLAIEGLTSPDGRVLGKMAHSERTGPYLAQNIAGAKTQPIFTAGVEYFTK